MIQATPIYYITMKTILMKKKFIDLLVLCLYFERLDNINNAHLIIRTRQQNYIVVKLL